MTMPMINPYNCIDMQFLNLSGAAIAANEMVMFDTTPSGSATATRKVPIDPFSSAAFPLQNLDLVSSRLFGVMQADAASTAGDTPAVGASLQIIPDGDWGWVRVWGPCLVKVAETGDDAHLTAYGLSTTAGQLSEVTPISADPAGSTALVWTVACQVGQSGTTATAALRDVFILTAFTGGVRDIGCMLGTLV